MKATDVLINAAAKCKVPLKVLAPGDARLLDRYGARFALIRPDQHVAWRGNDFPADCDSLVACDDGFRRPSDAVADLISVSWRS